MDWQQYVNEDQIIEWRRHLHKHPELSFQEKETSAYICKILGGLEGMEILRPTETSVVGVLKGGKPGKVVGLRADIDALPIQEEVDLDFKSVNPGVMHSCGHDVHTATLLGAASALSQIRDRLNGTVKFIFQAAEEQPPGGARGIVDSGAVNDVDYFFGSHVLARLKAGAIACWPGPVTASPDTFTITIHGKGAHGSAPEASIDPVYIAAQVITNIQCIISRNISPYDNVVIGITSFKTDAALRIVPSTVYLDGGIKTNNSEMRALIHKRVEEVATGVCHAHRATCDVKINLGYEPIINDEFCVSVVQSVVKELYGEENLVRPRVLMAGDDYSAFGKIAPTVFFLIGSGSEEEGYEHQVHHPNYDLDEKILAIGCKTFVGCVQKLLG